MQEMLSLTALVISISVMGSLARGEGEFDQSYKIENCSPGDHKVRRVGTVNNDCKLTINGDKIHFGNMSEAFPGVRFNPEGKIEKIKGSAHDYFVTFTGTQKNGKQITMKCSVEIRKFSDHSGVSIHHNETESGVGCSLLDLAAQGKDEHPSPPPDRWEGTDATKICDDGFCTPRNSRKPIRDDAPPGAAVN